MIFFGTKGKVIPGHVVDGIECPSCGHSEFATFGVVRYFHLYWVPVIPTKKEVGIECTHCKKTVTGKEIPPELSKQIKPTLFTKKNTAPLFSGLIIISCLIAFGFYSIQRENALEMVYIEQPAVNDLYIVNLTKIFDEIDPEYKYGLMRLNEISAQTGEFQISIMAHNKMAGIRDDIENSEPFLDTYYETEPLYLDLERLKEMKDSGVIYDIERP